MWGKDQKRQDIVIAVYYCACCTRTENNNIVASFKMNNFVYYITYSLFGFLTTLNKLSV